jgi:hypothetical protein
LSFGRALNQVDAQSAAESGAVQQARAANVAMIDIFETLPKPTGTLRDAPADRRLHAAELRVLAPIHQLTTGNKREYAVSEAAAKSAD